MTITDAKMKWGAFSIPLKPDTPRSIVNQLDTSWYALIRVYASQIDPSQVGTAPGLFSGPLLDRPDRFTAEGASATWYLGESTDGTGVEELGPVTGTTIFFDGSTNGSLTDWFTTALFAPDCGLTWNYIGGPASSTKWAGTFSQRTSKTMLDAWICPRFGVEYRVNPDLTVDCGYTSQLYPLASPMPLAVRKGGRDLNVVGLQATELGMTASMRDSVQRVISVISSPSTFQVVNTSPWPYKNPQGNTLSWTYRKSGTSSSQATVPLANGEALADAQAEVALRKATDRQIEISTKDYAITSRVKHGEYIYVYDVDEGLFDQSNQVTYRGKLIYPVLLRVEEVTWPLEQGMSVHLDNRHQAGGLAVTDLTRYIDFASEPDHATITVGKPPTTIGRIARPRR